MVTLSRMTGKDFSGPVPEIRVPTPQPMIEPPYIDPHDNHPAPEVNQRKSRKKKVTDDGVIIVGQADTFVPFPSSP